MTKTIPEVIDFDPISYARDACNMASMAIDYMQNDIRPVISAVVTLAESYADEDLTRDDFAARLLTIMRLAIAGRRTVDLVIDTFDSENMDATNNLRALEERKHG